MATRRSKKTDMITPIPTPEKQLDHPSGWCITELHEGCKFQFNHGKCGCWCHTGKPKPVKVVDEDAPKPKRTTRVPKPTVENTAAPEVTPKRRGRPPKIKTETIMINDPRPWKRQNA